MNITKHLEEKTQYIMKDGEPAFAVIPYKLFRKFIKILEKNEEDSLTVPHDVVSYMVDGDSPVKAWRKYLRLTQKEAAEKIGITQGALSQIEKSESNQRGTLEKVADAYGLHVKLFEV